MAWYIANSESKKQIKFADLFGQLDKIKFLMKEEKEMHKSRQIDCIAYTHYKICHRTRVLWTIY